MIISRRFLTLAVALVIPALGIAQGQFFDSNGARVHYVDRGTGEPIVLVHGRGGSVQEWVNNGVLDNLAKDYRVIALDCRGHGKSDKPHDPKKYGREMGLDVVRLLDHLRIKRAHIVGYSMGAMITAQLLTLHPERFLTATLGGAAGRFEWSETEEKMYEVGADETERLGFSPTLSQWIAPPGTPNATLEEIKKRSATLLADPIHDRYAIAALIRSFRDQVISPAQASAVTVSTMGLAGSADPQVEALRKLHRLRPSVKLVIIEGGTHSGNGDVRKRPEFVLALRDFVARGGRSE